jgi:tetratricopeptide (TPR) repeat protein
MGPDGRALPTSSPSRRRHCTRTDRHHPHRDQSHPAALADGAEVVVVAGSEPGLTAVERAGERGVRTMEGIGPISIATAIESVASDTVLVVHDDVEIAPALLEDMVEAAGGGDLVVPGENRGVGRQRVERTSLACVIGPRATLVDLARVAAFTPGLTAAVPAIVTRGRGYRHHATCTERLVTPDLRDGRPLLVAALIVRDEEATLATCLSSLEGVVDRIEVADTGSTDATVAVAEAAGATVQSIEWRDDFAWARNQVLDRCRDARFVLWIDADERFSCDDPGALRSFLATFGSFHDAFRVPIDNVAEGRVTHVHAADRIVGADTVHFVGAIHERPTHRGGGELTSVAVPHARIVHTGYAADVVAERDKRRRNLEIAQRNWEAAPSLERAVPYYRELASELDDPRRSLDEMQRVIPDLDRVHPVPLRASLLALEGRLHLEAGDHRAALHAAHRATELVPADVVAGAVLAEALVRLGRDGEALDRADALAQRPSPAPIVDDLLAASTRASSLVRAAISARRFDDARRWIGAIGHDNDPWPLMARTFGADAVAGLAAEAGENQDWRFLRWVSAAGLDGSEVARARATYRRTGGDLDVADRRAEAALQGEDAWRRARDVAGASGRPDDVVAYAVAVAGTHDNVLAELAEIGAADGLDGDAADRVAAQAWSVAAGAQLAAGRVDEAIGDAIAAMERWAGALRAAEIAAGAALDGAMPEVARDVVAAALVESEAGTYDDAPAESAVAARHRLRCIAVRSWLAEGHLAAAAGEALEVLEEGGCLGCWPDLVQAGSDDQWTAVLVGLALIGDGDGFVAAVAGTQRIERTATLCLTYLAAGGTATAAVTTGLLAAVLANREDLAAMVADHGGALDPDTARQLVGRLENDGRAAVAARLASTAGLIGVGASPGVIEDIGSDLTGGFQLG